MKVLDLFCGCGGLSIGFSKNGFKVLGVDKEKEVTKIFKINNIGKTKITDLNNNIIKGDFDIIVGGPPCKPWSSINVTKRGKKHKDFSLIRKFFNHIVINDPDIFVLENVPPAREDIIRELNNSGLYRIGYKIESKLFKYSNFGASTSRERLFFIGRKDSNTSELINKINKYKKPAKNVADVIGHLKNKKNGEIKDHEIPELNTIDKYKKYYKNGKFGWYILKWDEPAPSFGNIMKTYILHPSSWNGSEPRVISIKEALLIMGFDNDFKFPEGMSMSGRYQMTVDSVSPIFSDVLSKVIKDIYENK